MKRYKMESGGEVSYMEESTEGEYVRHEDAQKMVDEVTTSGVFAQGSSYESLFNKIIRRNGFEVNK